MLNYNHILMTGLTAVFILLVSCSKDNMTTQEEIDEIDTTEEIDEVAFNENDSIGYLALGDSYTIGQGVEETMRWPNQLSNKLKEKDINLYKTKIIARTGWTTRNLIDAIERNDLDNLASEAVVSLLIGVNNQYQNIDFEIFKTEFNMLLNMAIQFAGSHEDVFVVSIPDYGVTPFGNSNSEEIGLELDMYNEYMAIKCKDAKIPFIDITEISRNLGDSDNALASDNLHPSGFQYEKWVEEILPVVIEIFTE